MENVTGAAQYNGLRAVLDSDPDGLTVGIVHSRWFQRQAIVGDIPGFDFDDVHVLGSPTFTVGGDTYCVDRSVATSWQDVLDLGRPLRIGTYRPGTEPVIEFMAANGAPFEVVYGYPGTLQIMEAFDRRELDLSNRCGPGTGAVFFPEWISQGRLVPLFYVTKPFDQGYLARLGHTSPVPSFLELPGLDLDETQQARMAALQAYLLLQEVTRVFILPANVPGELRQYWQERFDLIMEDRRLEDSMNEAGYVDWYGHGRPDQMLPLIYSVERLGRSVKDFLYDLSGLNALDRFVSGG